MISTLTDEYSEIATQIEELQELCDRLANVDRNSSYESGSRDIIRWRDGEFISMTREGPWHLGKYEKAKATLTLLLQLRDAPSQK